MSIKASSVYLDTSVVLAYLGKEPGRSEVVKAAMRKAQQPGAGLQLWTSPLTIVEVTHLKHSDQTLDPASFQLIEDFWDNAPLEIIEFSEEAGNIARKHLQERILASSNDLPKGKKRAIDVSHLSIAEWMGADQFWTYDDDFPKYNVLGILICEPHGQVHLADDFL